MHQRDDSGCLKLVPAARRARYVRARVGGNALSLGKGALMRSWIARVASWGGHAITGGRTPRLSSACERLAFTVLLESRVTTSARRPSGSSATSAKIVEHSSVETPSVYLSDTVVPLTARSEDETKARRRG